MKNISSLLIIKNQSLNQAAKYFVVGGLCTILDISLLFTLTNFFGLNYLLSSVISFMSGSIVNYFLCINWIFEIRVVKKRYQEFIYYLIITVVGLGINTLLIWIFTAFFGFYFMLSKLFAISATYFWNFSARKYFLHTIK